MWDLVYPDDVPTEAAFGGSLAVDRRDRLSIGHVRGSHQRLLRTRERVRRSERECLLATFVERGDCTIAQDDRAARLGPGDFCLYDSTRPYQIDVPGDLTATIVMIDRRLIEPLATLLSGACAVSFRSTDPAGGLAFRFWRDLSMQSHVLDDAGLDNLVRGGLGIIEAAATDLSKQAHLVRRITRYYAPKPTLPPTLATVPCPPPMWPRQRGCLCDASRSSFEKTAPRSHATCATSG